LPARLSHLLSRLLPPPRHLRYFRGQDSPLPEVHSVRHEVQPHVQRQPNRAHDRSRSQSR
jgi:hypothetical protein